MVYLHNKKAEEAEKKMQTAIADMKDEIYRSVGHAVKELSISKTTLHYQMKSEKSRSEGQEMNQLLTRQEEKALAIWISTSTAVGNLVQHDFIREMAEKLIKRHVFDGQVVPQIGPTQVPSFLHCHCYLKTKMTHAIEAARIKDVKKEQVLYFNEEFHHIIREHNICLEDIFNADETGSQHC